MFVGWLECQQDCTKASQRISKKLGWWTTLGPEQTPLTFGEDLDKWTNPGIGSNFP